MPWPAYWKPHLWMTRREAGLMTRQETCSTLMVGGAEGEVDQRMRGLGRIATPPVGLADPVAELQPAIGGVQPGAADEGAGVRRA